MRRSLVVPCYQEEEALKAFRALVPLLDVEEILFVDDGSTDGTAGILRSLEVADERIRILTHDHNRGVGAAMRTGLEASRGEVVVVYDVDRTYPPETIGRLVEAVEAGADIATASPFVEGGELEDVPFHRAVLSRGAAMAYRMAVGASGKQIRTYTCAFRAYRRSWISRLAFESDGFAAAAEILGLALQAGAKVVEVPAPLTARREGESKMHVGRAMRGHVRVIRRLALRRMTGA